MYQDETYLSMRRTASYSNIDVEVKQHESAQEFTLEEEKH